MDLNDLHKSLYKKLYSYSQDYEKLNALLTSGEDQTDEAKLARKNIDKLSQRNSYFEQLQQIINEAAECAAMAEDESMKDLVKEEKEDLLNRLEELTQEAVDNLLPSDKYDDCNIALVEFRPGVGGGESMIFAEEMYHAF